MAWPNLFTRRRRTKRPRSAFIRVGRLEALEPRVLLAADIALDTVADGLASPVVATHANDGSGRMFIAEQGGAIRIIRDGAVDPTLLLNLGAGGLNRIVTGGERGLLGLAFHPDFALSDATGEGKFYVYYSAPATLGGNHDSVVSEFQISTDPDVADSDSERELLRFNQPFSNHNAGDLHFGPDDGLLYISSGDGGAGGDPQNNAQDLSNLLGKILRIDVEGDNGPGGRYGIPASNPFVGQASARAEIYAYGLRNPYRFSFDDGPDDPGLSDRLFVGDVGQGAFEEVNLVTSGGNYGWRIREGAHPFNTNDPDPGDLIDPIAEYANDATVNAVIGGFVYRGSAFPALEGRYIFGDLLGKLFVLDEESTGFVLSELEVEGGNPGSIIGFGEDEAGELYVLTFSQLLSIRAVDHPWRNLTEPLDVNGDGSVSPLDALVVINELNARQISDDTGRLPLPPTPPQTPPPFYDVTGDDFATSLDALVVINFLNDDEASGEGEATDLLSIAPFATPFSPSSPPSCEANRGSGAAACRSTDIDPVNAKSYPVEASRQGAGFQSERLWHSRRVRSVLFASSPDLIPDLISDGLLHDIAVARRP